MSGVPWHCGDLLGNNIADITAGDLRHFRFPSKELYWRQLNKTLLNMTD